MVGKAPKKQRVFYLLISFVFTGILFTLPGFNDNASVLRDPFDGFNLSKALYNDLKALLMWLFKQFYAHKIWTHRTM